MKFAALAKLSLIVVLTFAGFSIGHGAEALGQFDGQTDIGTPKLAGSGTYDSATQEYTLSGAGTNMWFGADEFHFVWKKMKGDFILRTRTEFVGKGAVAHRKIGWMVRPNLEPDAPYADCAQHGDGLCSLQFRPTKGTNTDQVRLPITNANVLQFERKGTTFIFCRRTICQLRAHQSGSWGRSVRRVIYMLAHARRRGESDFPRRTNYPPRKNWFCAVSRLYRKRPRNI